MYDKPLLQFEMQQGFFVVQYRKGLSGKRLIREKAYQGQKPGHQKNAGQQGGLLYRHLLILDLLSTVT